MTAESKLYGLVLCGGKSTRIGFDKSDLIFHNNMKQKYFLYELLRQYCEEVFISCRESQKDKIDNKYKVLTDLPVYENSGPMTGLLSFREKFPDTAVLAVGCDYPFIDCESIEKLIQHRNDKAVCYINKSNDNIFEPLLTIYEASFLKTIQDNFFKKNFSLSRILEQEMVNTIEPPKKLTLKNVNSEDELLEADSLIRKVKLKHKAGTD